MAEIMLAYPALYITATLVVNLLVLQGKADMKGASILNLITGIVASAFAMYNFFVVGGELGILTAAQASLFAFTYLIFFYEFYTGKKDNRAAGWYCLFVAINVVPFAYYTFQAGLYILGINWIWWGIAWFMFWVLMGIQKTQYFKLTLVLTWITTLILWVCALGWLLGWFGF